MTGYARVDGEADGIAWIWEAKSVNGRGLDIRCRLAPGMDSLEPSLRAALADRMARGSVSVSLALSRRGGAVRPHVDREFLDSLLEMARSYAAETGAEPPRMEALLAVRGVVELAEPEETEAERRCLAAALLVSFEGAADQLAAARRHEGGAPRSGGARAARRSRRPGIAGGGVGFAATREGALAPCRADRRARRPGPGGDRRPRRPGGGPAADQAGCARGARPHQPPHLAQARELLAAGGAVGRRLDFLAQELNREANTVCAKASDNDLSRVGLDLKTVIDRLREQVQNIE